MKRNIIIFAVLAVVAMGFVAAGWLEKLIRLTQRPAFSYEQIHENLIRKNQQQPHNTVLLLGDSHVAGICEGCLSRPAVNFGIGGDTVAALSRRIRAYGATRDATNIAILEIGSNDVMWEHKTELANDYAALLQQLSVLKHVYVFATLPVAKTSARPSYNKRIAHAAEQLHTACNATTNCSFHVLDDVYDVDGFLKEGLHMPDGIHLNEHGYKVWIERIDTILKSSRSEPSDVQ